MAETLGGVLKQQRWSVLIIVTTIVILIIEKIVELGLTRSLDKKTLPIFQTFSNPQALRGNPIWDDSALIIYELIAEAVAAFQIAVAILVK